MMLIQTLLPTSRTLCPDFHEHPDHVELKSDAVPGPSHEKNYKTDPSIQPSEVIYMQIKER